MRKLLTALLTTGALLGAAGSAAALTVGTSFTVSATVLKTCSVAATNLGFGNYTPGSGVVPTATSTISVNCTKGTTFTVALDKGTTAGGSITQRLMLQTAGASTLQYNLCTTAVTAAGACNGATLFGDGTGGTNAPAGTGAGMGGGNVQTVTVFGGVPDNAFNQAAAVAASGSSPYTDTVAVLVTY